MVSTAYIGIGSNQRYGELEPAQLVEAAMGELAGVGRVTARSSLYATQPVGAVAQPAFVNAAVALETSLTPELLLAAMLECERRYGRDRMTGIPKGPRTLDLDLLLMVSPEGEGILVDTPALMLPHPELAHRRFVLTPLAEIAPGLRHPMLGTTMAGLLAELPDEGANAVGAVHRMEAARETP